MIGLTDTKEHFPEESLAQELAPFFDLLARFDFEDKQKESSALNSDPLVSAPRRSELGSELS